MAALLCSHFFWCVSKLELAKNLPNSTMGNNQKKKEAAAVHNFVLDVGENTLYIGRCGYCSNEEGQGGLLAVYLKSRPENMTKYYCMECSHTGDLRDIDKKDSFLFPLVDIVGEVARHYDADVFDKHYNS